MRNLRSTGFSKKLTSDCSVSSDGCAPFTSSWPVTSDPELCPRWPASPICSTRLVTVAMAWKRVLQNWMNSRCGGRDERGSYECFIKLYHLVVSKTNHYNNQTDMC
uniref:Uncharacterized protein n=1 Tax=Lates calcarifer TaxID=8187 RepID=A0A4W6DNI7_LATCA